MTRQGNVVLLTRSDGTMFSVPASEVDFAATSALKAAPAPIPAGPAITPPPSSPAEAARAGREGPKARVRITDDDVSHSQETSTPEGEKKKTAPGVLTPAKVDVGDYTQQKAGDRLVIHGVLRNTGATTATSARVAVAALGDKGETIDSSEGMLSGGTIEPGQQIEFSVSLKVGQKIVSSLRFMPIWTPAPVPAPPDAAGRPAGRPVSSTGPGSADGSMSAEASPAAPAAAPTPAPTPYGRGVLYAAPAPASSMDPPADGRAGYIPGATRKEDQPKPPQ
jgi:hypothetical protein